MSLRRILGTIQPGQGDASKNCQRLIGAAAVHCPEIADYGLFGTIDVQLDEPFDKTRADCWTPKLVWVPISFNIRGQTDWKNLASSELVSNIRSTTISTTLG